MSTPWQEKVWGKTRELVYSQFYSLHELQVVIGGYCSVHFHVDRANRFRVVDAEIEVVEFYGPSRKHYRLGPENVHDVPSLVPHMFLVRRGGTVYEEYYPDRGGTVRRDDIVRLSEGGMEEPGERQLHLLDGTPAEVVRRYLDARGEL